jgi:flagellar export protein FliJ
MPSRRFVFSLESIKSVREHTELVAMRQLAYELDRAAQLRAELGTAEARLNDACAAPGGVVTARDLSARHVYREQRKRELGDARQRADLQAEHVATGREQLASATRDRETLARLEGRQRAAHENVQRRAERTRSDEVSLAMRRHHLGGSA